MVVFGAVLPIAALATLPRSAPPAPPITHPRRSLGLALAYLILFALVVLGWLFGLARSPALDRIEQEGLILGLKAVTMTIVPFLLLSAHERGNLFVWPVLGRGRILAVTVGLGLIALLLALFATPAFSDILATRAPIGELTVAGVAATIWVILGAALPEEMLFRAYLQPRLAAVLGNDGLAIATGAVIFALVHVPGLYLRADQAALMHNRHLSLVASTAYAVAVLAPAGVLFGVIWARTRNLAVVVAVHALIDVTPNLTDALHLMG
jgi:membrane protease YdiL (CAAX protease family)